MHIYMLCENSDSVRNKNPKSLQVVLCVCVFIHAHVRFVKTLQVVQAQSLCVCVHVCVHMCIHSCTCTLCNDSVGNKNPKSLYKWYKPSLCVCAHVCTCTLCVRNKNQSHCKWYKPSLCECVCVCVCVCVHRCTFMHMYDL